MEATNEKGAAQETELGDVPGSTVTFTPEHEMPQAGLTTAPEPPAADDGNGEPSAPAKSTEGLLAEEVADLRSQLADAKRVMSNYERKVSRLAASQKRSVGKIPKRAAGDDASPEPASDDTDVTERANAITQYITSKFPELAKDEMGRKCGQDAYYSLRADGLIVPGRTDDLTAAQHIGERGMELLAAEKARAERAAKIKAATGGEPAAADEPKAPKTPMGAKPTTPARKKSVKDEEADYEKDRGAHKIPRA